MGDIKGYWDFTEGVRDIIVDEEWDWALTGFLGPMRGKDIYWGITKGSLAKFGCPVGYIDITDGSRAKLGCLSDITEDSRAMLGSPVGNMDITKGSRANFRCLVGYMDRERERERLPSMALESSVMSMYPIEQPNLALEPSVMLMYLTGHPNLAKDPLVMLH
jgi:hypothetical protein